MRHLFTITVCFIFLFACRKADHQNNDYLDHVRTALHDSLSSNDFRNVDFSHAVLSHVDSVDLYILRLPFKNSHAGNFILLQTSKDGAIRQGRFIDIEGEVKKEKGKNNFQGNIAIQSLQRKLLVESSISDGFILAFHNNNQSRTSLVEPSHVLPEVIITTYVSSGGVSWSSWIWLQSLFNGSYVQPYYGYFNTDTGMPWTGGGGGGSTSGGNNPYPTGGGGGGGPIIEEPMLVDFESQDENAEIDIEKFINCFHSIPDAGSTCTIEILADIPVDKDPNKIFNISTNSPGHTFLNIRKKNGSQSASQNIGFYPKSGYKTVLTNAPIDGKFVDNGLHEFNAGFLITITPAQLAAAITQMQRSKNWKYDIDNYNCTDWALDVFNAAGGNLTIPLYDIPGNYPSVGTRMPNGVYNKLKEMKAANDPRAGGITIDIVKGFAGNSTGQCN